MLILWGCSVFRFLLLVLYCKFGIMVMLLFFFIFILDCIEYVDVIVGYGDLVLIGIRFYEYEFIFFFILLIWIVIVINIWK